AMVIDPPVCRTVVEWSPEIVTQRLVGTTPALTESSEWNVPDTTPGAPKGDATRSAHPARRPGCAARQRSLELITSSPHLSPNIQCVRTSSAHARRTMWFVTYPARGRGSLMGMVGGLHLHRRQITFEVVVAESGDEWRGQVCQP